MTVLQSHCSKSSGVVQRPYHVTKFTESAESQVALEGGSTVGETWYVLSMLLMQAFYML